MKSVKSHRKLRLGVFSFDHDWQFYIKSQDVENGGGCWKNKVGGDLLRICWIDVYGFWRGSLRNWKTELKGHKLPSSSADSSGTLGNKDFLGVFLEMNDITVRERARVDM